MWLTDLTGCFQDVCVCRSCLLTLTVRWAPRQCLHILAEKHKVCPILVHEEGHLSVFDTLPFLFVGTDLFLSQGFLNYRCKKTYFLFLCKDCQQLILCRASMLDATRSDESSRSTWSHSNSRVSSLKTKHLDRRLATLADGWIRGETVNIVFDGASLDIIPA